MPWLYASTRRSFCERYDEGKLIILKHFASHSLDTSINTRLFFLRLHSLSFIEKHFYNFRKTSSTLRLQLERRHLYVLNLCTRYVILVWSGHFQQSSHITVTYTNNGTDFNFIHYQFMSVMFTPSSRDGHEKGIVAPVPHINNMSDKGRITMARKAMVSCSLSLNVNGLWEEN